MWFTQKGKRQCTFKISGREVKGLRAGCGGRESSMASLAFPPTRASEVSGRMGNEVQTYASRLFFRHRLDTNISGINITPQVYIFSINLEWNFHVICVFNLSVNIAMC